MSTLKQQRAALRRLGKRQISAAEIKYSKLYMLSYLDRCLYYLHRLRRPMSTMELMDAVFDNTALQPAPRNLRSMVYTALWRAEKRGEVTRIIEENSNERGGWREAIWSLGK